MLSVFLALGVKNSMRMCNAVICGLSGCISHFHIIA